MALYLYMRPKAEVKVVESEQNVENPVNAEQLNDNLG